LAINKTVKQSNPKFKNSRHQLNTLNHENTKKMPTVSPDTSRETVTILYTL